MTFAERFNRWNLWYDGLPELWRFQFILWPLLALGAINMWLTVAVRVPFGLLVVLGILFIAAVRVPYILGRTLPASDASSDRSNSGIVSAPWLIDLNHRYEEMPESRRIWVYPAILLIAGAINMMLTIWHAFPFGLLFLIALLVLVALRAPYTAGWIIAPTPELVPETGHTPELANDQTPTLGVSPVAHEGTPDTVHPGHHEDP